MKVIDLDQDAGAAVGLLKSLANPTRLRILCHLAEGERPVGALVERLGLREANVSQHLALLRRDGLVRTRRAGQTIFYAIDDPAALKVIRVLHAIYCRSGAGRREPRAKAPSGKSG